MPQREAEGISEMPATASLPGEDTYALPHRLSYANSNRMGWIYELIRACWSGPS